MVNYPKDWKQDKIIDVADIFDNLRIPVAESIRVKGNTPYYGANGIQGYIKGYTHDGEFVLIAEDGASSLLDYPITFTRGKIWVNNHAHVLSGKDKILDNEYLAYALKKVNYEKIIVGGTRIKLNGSTLKAINLQYPKYTEQRKIALALNSFDTHIKNLSKLIEKKKMIRDGAVEDLVSGEKRLSNFSGEWDYKPVKSITKDVITGGTPSTNIKEYWGGSIPWLASTEIHQKNIRKATKNISDLGLLNSSAKIAPKDSVLIALAGQGKTRGTAAILGKNMAINQSLAALVCNEDNYYKFLFYAIEMNYEALRELSSGDGGRGGLNKKLIKDFKINIPSDKNEQTAIADILSSMDKEIENLEKEKEKYLQLKSGAMDDLLTGKIRLV
ncbi:TPA: restriction endonuclease subunit S [Streptococcus equi subsp. zooepidemicus]|nr:restriction endonuclease subunit S [Streptococcus equi subsp. zooepidemicus]HEL1033866.1 restriction endonuclease subunit S [Streptococcus equi subsp. zooepidemicus]HEL1081992.1 restriction endonuclease subunit S [Streptococcus equi subsp. zooepidemicus]HEL1083724.1 restriction endonuclease subunit S [Streptococcus equi subsp. zooepidemicus]HEL1164230.1 restriction endonuclease subunit S [Streptococcus equi subsp. zooepidemicus]